MNIINDRNYPPEVIIAMQKDFYDGAGDGTFGSPSSLDEPPKLFWTKKHVTESNKPVPASSLFAILEGNMRHAFFEDVMRDNPDYKVEERLYANIECNGETFKISGKFDLTRLSTNEIRDWKSMKTAKYKIGDWEHYTFQQNVYKWLWSKNGLTINKLTLLILLKDWNQMDKYKDRDYPPGESFEHPVDVWTNERTEAEIRTRIGKLLPYRNKPVGEINPCSKTDRWQKDDSYPVFSLTKQGTKRVDEKALPGTTKFKTEDEAKADIAKRKEPWMYYYKFRPSTPIRCLNWCPVAKTGICQFYNEWTQTHGEQDAEITD